MRYIVDTNVAIAMLAQRQSVIERLSSIAPEELGLSVLVIGELLFGARRSARMQSNVARAQALAERFPHVRALIRAEAAGSRARYARARRANDATGYLCHRARRAIDAIGSVCHTTRRAIDTIGSVCHTMRRAIDAIGSVCHKARLDDGFARHVSLARQFARLPGNCAERHGFCLAGLATYASVFAKSSASPECGQFA